MSREEKVKSTSAFLGGRKKEEKSGWCQVCWKYNQLLNHKNNNKNSFMFYYGALAMCRHYTKHVCYLILKAIMKSEVVVFLSAAVTDANFLHCLR